MTDKYANLTKVSRNFLKQQNFLVFGSYKATKAQITSHRMMAKSEISSIKLSGLESKLCWFLNW